MSHKAIRMSLVCESRESSARFAFPLVIARKLQIFVAIQLSSLRSVRTPLVIARKLQIFVAIQLSSLRSVRTPLVIARKSQIFVAIQLSSLRSVRTPLVIARKSQIFVAIQRKWITTSDLTVLLVMTKRCHFIISKYRSFHSGFCCSINSIFFFLLPAFICFSLLIACSISENTS